MTTVETKESTYDMFIDKTFQQCNDAWGDEKNFPSSMETILMRKAGLFKFLFGMYNFDNEEIDKEILNYDAGNMELRIFGKRVYLNLDLVSKQQKFHT